MLLEVGRLMNHSSRETLCSFLATRWQEVFQATTRNLVLILCEGIFMYFWFSIEWSPLGYPFGWRNMFVGTRLWSEVPRSCSTLFLIFFLNFFMQFGGFNPQKSRWFKICIKNQMLRLKVVTKCEFNVGRLTPTNAYTDKDYKYDFVGLEK